MKKSLPTLTLYAGATPVAVTRKRVRNLNLRVRADGTVHLSVPAHASTALVQRFLDERAGWVAERLARKEQRGTPHSPTLWGRPIEPAAASDLEALWRRETASALPEVARRMEAALGVHATGWQLRAMSSRWGSCTPSTGRIRINTRLAAYDPTCLDYVVAHELTHLLEPSHNARFHQILATAYPDEAHARALLRATP